MPSTTVIKVDTTVGQAKFKALREALEPRTLLTIIGARFTSFVDESFRTDGRGKWKPLAWSTLAMRQRGGTKPLQDTGHYKQSFVMESDYKTYVEVGTSLKVGAYSLGRIHEFGTGPYTIRVRTARVLAGKLGPGASSIWGQGPVKVVGNWRATHLFFGREVHHPGISARPVLPTRQEAEKMILETVDAALAKLPKGK